MYTSYICVLYMYVFTYIIRMYACMYVYTYVCMCICMCVCVCVCAETCRDMCVRVYAHTHIFVHRLSRHVYARVKVYKFTHIQLAQRPSSFCKRITAVWNTSMYVCTYIHACMYAHWYSGQSIDCLTSKPHTHGELS